MEPADTPWEIRFATVNVKDLGGILRRIRDAGKLHSAHIICFNAESLTGIRHVDSAIRHALRNMKSGEMISNSFEMEALLYAAGSRQCSVAASFGIHEGQNQLYVCCCPAPGGIWDDLKDLFCLYEGRKELPMDSGRQKHLMSLFGITIEEIEAAGPDRLEDLVLERVALLVVNR